MELVSVIALLGIGVAILVTALLLYSPFGNHTANRILAAFLLVLSLFLIQHTMSVEGLAYRYPHLQGITLWLYFLLGPLLYFYTHALTSRKSSSDARYVLHGLPTVFAFIAYLPALFQSAAAKRAFVESYSGTQSHLPFADAAVASGIQIITVTVGILYFLFAVQLAVYAVFSQRLLRRHHQGLYDNFSDLDRIQLRWLRVLSMLVLIAAGLIMSSFLLNRVFPDIHLAQQELGSTFLVTGLIYFVGFMGLSQPATYTVALISSSANTAAAAAPGPKYEKSGLSAELRQLLWHETEQYMQQHKPFLQQGLTIGRLAELLGTSVAYLSQTINAESGQNFHDYVNHYRIDEARCLIKASLAQQLPNKLYLQVGYKSKSNFYAQFKKYCGNQTPNQYREKLLK